jgi:hypothetical protein
MGNLKGASYVFQVGKRYEIRMIICGEETMSWGTIERYEYPLLKFSDVNIRSRESHLPDTTLHGEIINVTSPYFISAVLHQSLTQEQVSRDNAAVRKSAAKED